MLKIRLKRVGRKNDPSYRVVVVPSTTGPKSGNVLEVLGNYDPRRDIKEVNAERVKHWIAQGAQVSDTVHNILIGLKVIEGKKRNVLPKKSAPIKEAAPAEEPAQEAPDASAPEAEEETAVKSEDSSSEAPVAEEAIPEASNEESQG